MIERLVLLLLEQAELDKIYGGEQCFCFGMWWLNLLKGCMTRKSHDLGSTFETTARSDYNCRSICCVQFSSVSYRFDLKPQLEDETSSSISTDISETSKWKSC